MPKICFVSQTAQIARPINDGSVRYRCYHPAEALTRNGHPSTVYSAPKFFSEPTFDYDVYVFHRPTTSVTNFSRTIEALKRAGKLLIADYDDLIFGDEEIALDSSIVKNKVKSPEQAIDIFSNNLDALLEFTYVSTSTTPLANEVRRFNPSAIVKVNPNFIAPSLLELHNKLGTFNIRRSSTSIGYFAGTKSHDKDFPIVSEALYRTLVENPSFQLTVVGPVKLPRAFAMLSNVVAAPVVNYLRLPGLMTHCQTVIAPLETSRFNDCKSRVKYLEASLSGCRLLATPIPDMEILGSERMGLMHTTNDWYEALSNPFASDVYQELASANFEHISNLVNTDNLEYFWEQA